MIVHVRRGGHSLLITCQVLVQDMLSFRGRNFNLRYFIAAYILSSNNNMKKEKKNGLTKIELNNRCMICPGFFGTNTCRHYFDLNS